jgi:hypothetical protein
LGEGRKRLGRRLRALSSRIAASPTRDTQDRLDNSVEVFDHVLVGDVHDGQAKSFEEPITPAIIILPIFMALTVDFDNQIRPGTIEVDDVGFDGVLPPEFQATALAAGEGRPKNPFGLGHCFSQLAGTCSSELRYGREAAVRHQFVSQEFVEMPSSIAARPTMVQDVGRV